MLENSGGAAEVAGRHLEWLIKTLHEEQDSRGEDTPQAEDLRGQLRATKWMIELFCGRRVKDGVLVEIRKKTGRPIPHIVPLGPDGERHGFDSDAG